MTNTIPPARRSIDDATPEEWDAASRAVREGDQPKPVPNEHPPVWPLVMVDMASRDHLGRKRYGTPLQPFNGRDALRDAYEEALDLAVYLRTAIFERDGK
jgi:hypothetical protein